MLLLHLQPGSSQGQPDHGTCEPFRANEEGLGGRANQLLVLFLNNEESTNVTPLLTQTTCPVLPFLAAPQAHR